MPACRGGEPVTRAELPLFFLLPSKIASPKRLTPSHAAASKLEPDRNDSLCCPIRDLCRSHAVGARHFGACGGLLSHPIPARLPGPSISLTLRDFAPPVVAVARHCCWNRGL